MYQLLISLLLTNPKGHLLVQLFQAGHCFHSGDIYIYNSKQLFHMFNLNQELFTGALYNSFIDKFVYLYSRITFMYVPGINETAHWMAKPCTTPTQLCRHQAPGHIEHMGEMTDRPKDSSKGTRLILKGTQYTASNESLRSSPTTFQHNQLLTGNPSPTWKVLEARIYALMHCKWLLLVR